MLELLMKKLERELASITCEKPSKLQKEYWVRNKFFLGKSRVTSLLRVKLKKKADAYGFKKSNSNLQRVDWLVLFEFRLELKKQYAKKLFHVYFSE